MNPQNYKFIKTYIIADDFINGILKYCLWIRPEDEAKVIPLIT
ncbi:type IIL restriction-modification enzyme MmeI [Rhinopithecimicrobium faecis]